MNNLDFERMANRFGVHLVKHSTHHYKGLINGAMVDFWPSINKYREVKPGAETRVGIEKLFEYIFNTDDVTQLNKFQKFATEMTMLDHFALEMLKLAKTGKDYISPADLDTAIGNARIFFGQT